MQPTAQAIAFPSIVKREHLDETVAVIRQRYRGPVPQIAIVLGSGLGGVGSLIENMTVIPYSDLPYFARSTVPGHKGNLLIGTLGGTVVACMQGRFHLYEGYSAQQATYPIRALRHLGCKILVVSNAAGCLNSSWRVGDIMMISDHINLQGQNPLIGPNMFGGMWPDSECPRFPDMQDCYSVALRNIARQVATSNGLSLHEGVYVGLSGPSYETAAEHRFLRTIGADCVGMSTVAEVIVAVHSGMRVVGFSLCTNLCLFGVKTNHKEVEEAGRAAQTKMSLLVKTLVPELEKTLPPAAPAPAPTA